MMKKSLLLFSVLVLALFAVTLVASGPAHAQKKPVVLRLVLPVPGSDYPLGYICEYYAKRFNDRVPGGEYKMEVHGGGALAKLPEYFDALRVGAVEMALAPWGFYAFMDPRLSAVEVPLLINNQAAGAYAATKFLPLYDQILQEKFNQKGLGLMCLAGNEYVGNKPVKTLEDWKGLLLGSLSPMTSELAKALGASPVVIMWTDFYESLQKKVIDGVTNGTHGSVNMNLFDICKYSTIYFGLAQYNGFGINLDVYKKMPPNIQKILQEEATAAVNKMHEIMVSLDADDLKKMKEKGVTVYFLPPAERDRWVKALTPFKEKQLTSLGDFGGKVKQIADEANKKFPYTGMAPK
jgi:TRAP-type C4-dicarboxylate transport system substrate-binding protein